LPGVNDLLSSSSSARGSTANTIFTSVDPVVTITGPGEPPAVTLEFATVAPNTVFNESDFGAAGTPVATWGARQDSSTAMRVILEGPLLPGQTVQVTHRFEFENPLTAPSLNAIANSTFGYRFTVSGVDITVQSERVPVLGFRLPDRTNFDFTVRHVFPEDETIGSQTITPGVTGDELTAAPRTVTGWAIDTTTPPTVTPTGAGTFNADHEFTGVMPNDHVVVTFTYVRVGFDVIYNLGATANAGTGPATETSVPIGEHTLLQTPVPTHPNVTFEEESTPVLFVGWSLTPPARRLTGSQADRDHLATIVRTTVDIVDRNVPVYAIWGYDTTGNDIPDVLGDRFSVTYNLGTGNAVGTAHDTVQNILAGTNFLLTTVRPTHENVGGEVVSFVGWSLTAPTRILTGSDADRAYLAALNTTDRINNISRDETVFAVWGYGYPPYVTRSRVNITYEANGGLGAPAQQTNVIVGTNPALTTMTYGHAPQGETPVLFVGWTLSTNRAAVEGHIFTGSDADRDRLPERITQITNIQANTTVIAIWGVDTTGNGTPDVLDDRFTVTYNLTTSTVGTPPPGQPNNIRGSNVTLHDGSGLTHQNVGDEVVSFVGWSLTAPSRILTGSDVDRAYRNTLVITEITNIQADTEVFAVWGYGEPPYVDRDLFTVTYNVGTGFDGPAPDTGVFAGVDHPLNLTDIPRHDNVGDREVSIIGWSLNPPTRILDANVTDDAYLLALGLVTSITNIQADTEVFAVWGYGYPPYIDRQRFTVTYDPTLGTGGPSPDTNIVIGWTWPLNVTDVPTHPNEDVDGVSTPVLFVGWTLSNDAADHGIFTRYDNMDGEIDDIIITQIANIAANTTVYAIWGFDTNGNGTPDVIDTRFRVIFDMSEADNYQDEPATQVVLSGQLAVEPEVIPYISGMIYIGWGYRNQAGEVVEFDFDTPITGNITLFPIWVEHTVELIPNNYIEGIGAGFTIIRGRWANETTHEISFFVRVNGSADPVDVLAEIDRFTLTATPSYGFERIGEITAFSNILTVETLDITAASFGDVVEIEGVDFLEITVNVTATLMSGIVDFVLSYESAGGTRSLATATYRILIPGDTNKDGRVNVGDHTDIFNMMRGYSAIPQRFAAGAYVFELADLNKDDRINVGDHTILFNLMRGYTTIR